MTAYARVATARSGSGWTCSGNTATLAAIASFPAMAGGAGGTVTHFGLGRASSAAGELLFFGAVTPNLAVIAGITPKLDTGTVITQASDGLANTAATNLLKLIFNNTTWANVGDATGIVGSTVPGSLYLSLHTTPGPGEAGDQTTNEIAYT